MTGYPQNHYFFKSFTAGLSIKQFDDIYQTIESKYTKHEIKRHLHRRKDRKNIEKEQQEQQEQQQELVDVSCLLFLKTGLSWFKFTRGLYITYTLTGFLFDLDQSNVSRKEHSKD